MDVTRNPINNIPQPSTKPEAPAGNREQTERNAVAMMQARYGEKPKEGRPIKKTLDKDDFMKIMITEMKHQDPTKPMDADRMATQMAQITSVEQMKNVSSSLEKLADKSNASDRLAMSMMIGKTVTVDKGRFTHQKNTVSPISFDLPEDAQKIKLTILDERGEEVAVRELEPMPAGSNTYSWDGLNASNMQSPSSIYSIRIDAENKQGAKLKINPISKESVVGVTFEGGEANFLVGDSKSPQKVSLRNITRLEGDAAPKPAPGQAATASGVNGSNEKATSADNGEFALPETVKAKLGLSGAEGEAALKASQEQLTADSEVKSEGFPNGLKE